MYDVLITMPGTECIMYKHLLSILVQVVVTKCHRLGDLSKNHFLLTVLGTEESKMRVPAGLMSGESPLLGLQIKFLAVCSLAFLWCVWMEREEGLWILFFS